jgi:hypothetical protein
MWWQLPGCNAAHAVLTAADLDKQLARIIEGDEKYKTVYR